jgi:hypothetical protein
MTSETTTTTTSELLNPLPPWRLLLGPAAVSLALLCALLLTGCASSAPPQAAASPREHLKLVGELTDNGLGCPSLRTADGRIYNLARGLEGLENGQQLEVDGYVTTMARDCGLGTPLMPERAVRVRTAASGG